jgi:hypothetical protein
LENPRDIGPCGTSICFNGSSVPLSLETWQKITGTMSLYPWFMGFNSFMTLAGGVLSLTIAMTTGYKYLFIAGIISYSVLIVLQLSIRRTIRSKLRIIGSQTAAAQQMGWEN